MAGTKPPKGAWEKVGALIACGLAAGEVTTKILGYALQALVPSEVISATTAPLSVAILTLVAARQKTWTPGGSESNSKQKSSPSKAWTRNLYLASLVSSIATLIGFLGAIRERAHRLSFIEAQPTEAQICAIEGSKSLAYKTTVTLREPTVGSVIVICPLSFDEYVVAVAEATIGVDELGQWPVDVRCQRIAPMEDFESFSFTACMGSVSGRKTSEGIYVGPDTSSGSIKRLVERRNLKWHEQIGSLL